MIKTNEYGGVTIGGMTDAVFSEYAAAGMLIARGAISEGYDKRVLRLVFETCFDIVMEVLEEDEKK